MIPRHLRYSPVNQMIVQWGHGAFSFSMCGMPQRLRSNRFIGGQEEETCCFEAPIIPEITWYDWARWLPEVGIGIDKFEEEVAAAYVREAAIEFASRSKVLQRSIFIEVQEGELSYAAEPYADERILDVLGVIDGGMAIHFGAAMQASGVTATIRPGSNTVTLSPKAAHSCLCGPRPHRYLEVLVSVAPTESACKHDSLLYENHRKAITAYARLLYVNALHFRDTGLVNSMQPINLFYAAATRAKADALRWINQAGSKGSGRPLFG